MMRRKSLRKLLASAMLAGVPAILASCGTGGEASLNGDRSVGTASLNVAVKFPDSDGVTPQFISQRAQCIEVDYIRGESYKHVILTPSSPTGQIQNIIPGMSHIRVVATDTADSDHCTGQKLDEINIAANIKEGANQLTATLIGNAKWKFVDENDQPAPIILNKTYPSSQEEIDSFNLFPGIPDMIGPSSIDLTKPFYKSDYTVVFKGKNLYVHEDNNSKCTEPETCITGGWYLLQFIGPSTTNNAFETNDVNLMPDNDSGQIERFFTIIGMRPGDDEYEGYYGYYGPGYYSSNFTIEQPDNTNVIDDWESRFSYTTVVSANRMEGVLAEVAIYSSNDNILCSFDNEGNNTFPCPPNLEDHINGDIGPASIKTVSLGSGISTQSIDNDNCYRNSTITEEEMVDYIHSPFVYCEPTTYRCDYNLDGVINDNDDMNGDNDVNQLDNYYIIKRNVSTGDICLHPFRAKAEEIPLTELNVTLQ